MDKTLKIDDPVGAVSVHGVGGLIGTILPAVFAFEDVGVSLGIQTLGSFAIVAYAFVDGFILFTVINKTFGLRCGRREEEEGLDVYEHGESCYN
ncbi:MAG: hypothetical protein K2K64_04400 [Muribaculaceae bacterium]|nr:hypothetical protein [Muribaculaceae bacterium]